MLGKKILRKKFVYKEQFVRQVRLLLKCLPAIRNQKYFALKGGTAINLFVKNLPRLSVDIDLTFRHLNDRETSLNQIQSGLSEIEESLKQSNEKFVIKKQVTQQSKSISKLLVYHQNTMIKIEPNFIMRGTLYPIEYGKLCGNINTEFDSFLDQMPMVSTPELYAGKLCAALNRQHPRDLFDLKLLYENGGITDKIRQAFVVYLASNPRPIHELLSPNRLDIQQVFEREFLQMTASNVSLNDLLEIREEVISKINEDMTENERRFLLSVKQGKPAYELMPFNNLDQLPSLKWKLINVLKMDKRKRATMIDKLKAVLQV